MMHIKKTGENTFEITRERLFELLMGERNLDALLWFGFLLPGQKDMAIANYTDYHEAESIEELVNFQISRICKRSENPENF